MTSFFSTLSLFILILFNGCFTVPIIEQYNSIAKLSTLIDDLTTESEFNTRSVPVDETSPFVDTENEHMGYNMSTSVYNSTEEQTGQSLRMTFTNEELSTPDGYHSNDFFSSTLESTTDSNQHYKRYQDEQSSSTIESITSESFTHVLRGLDADFENVTDADADPEFGKRAMPIELTTDFILPSTSTPSLEIQQFSASEPSSTTQKYVGLLKDDDDEQQHNHQHNHEHEPQPEPEHEPQTEVKPKSKPKPKPKPEANHDYEQHEDEQIEDGSHPHPEHKHEPVEKKPKKAIPSDYEAEPESEVAPKKKPKLSSHDESQDDNSKEATAPTAVFDQEALKHVSYPLDNVLVLDENNSLIVTDIPQKFSTSTIKNFQEETKLNQGEESLHAEEKEPNN